MCRYRKYITSLFCKYQNPKGVHGTLAFEENGAKCVKILTLMQLVANLANTK